MTPTREIYWNIAYGWLVYPLTLVVVGLIGLGLWRRWQVWRRGERERSVGPDRQTCPYVEPPRREPAAVKVGAGIATRRALRRRIAGRGGRPKEDAGRQLEEPPGGEAEAGGDAY